MSHATTPAQCSEAQRLRLLDSTMLMDTEASESFDRITRLASEIFEVPIALISLVDANRQWFKSRLGLDISETPREWSFCGHAIQQPDVMVVEDALLDPRFAHGPLVVGEPHVRFYAGAPLRLASGHALGSLCVIDRRPRSFSPAECTRLQMLAACVMSQIELHRRAGRVNEVTRLPNRTQMIEDFEEKMRLEPGAHRAMMLIDVMRHQRLEHAVRAIGIEPLEAILRKIASRLTRIVGPQRRIYHITESRFCLRIQGESRLQQEAFCRMVLEQLEQPFDSAGTKVELNVEAGMVEFDLDALGVNDALRKATAAMHEAFQRGEKMRWHDASLDAAHSRAYRLLRDFNHGLARGEVRLVYQPKLDVATNAYTGVEALARWRHPDFGEVSPGEFVTLIEKTALIHPFTHWVLETALAQIVAWHAEGIFVTVAINVSSRNLDQPGFCAQLASACAGHGVEPKWLQVECTETTVLSNAATLASLNELRRLGVQLSLDDFGMGYSNLSCLQTLPVQMLKLDRSLIEPIESDPAAHRLVKSLILLGHSLGFCMLAEGVETARTCALLVEAGCDALQGYHLARPMEAERVPAFVRYHRAQAVALHAEPAPWEALTTAPTHSPDLVQLRA